MMITSAAITPKATRLSDAFLAPYYAKGDPFRSLLARSTYLTKYSRDGESWTDTVRRVVEANVSLAGNVDEREAQLLFHLFWTMQALPPGRGLWTGGVEGIPADARYNCFAAETRFWANGRLTTFEEAAGQTVEVLCADGRWRPAEVRSFGKQSLRKIRMAAPGRSNFAHEFVATPDHRWITSTRGVVNDLRVGDRVLVVPSQIDKSSDNYIEGFTHGFVFGDGTKETLKRDIYKARLCGEKDRQFEAMLKASSVFKSASSPPSFNGDPLLYFKSDRNLKALPIDDAPVEYQAGFLAGWMAADGSARTDGRGGNRLASINGEAINWVIERAPLLGFCVTGHSLDPSTSTNFGPRSAPLGILTLVEEPIEYTVRSISDEGREEEVFCVTEPETQTFTLEGGVTTKNCWYTTLYGVEDWCWTANQLMLGGGVGVGLTEVSSLDSVATGNARFAVWCGASHPNIAEVQPNDKSFLNGQTPVFVVPDSREGWVEALRQVLTSAWASKDLIVDVSHVRPRGEKIRTFGGIACGPGPLTDLLRNAWEIVRGAAGRKLRTVEALDITNFIGKCIKAGNVRRSALIALGDAYDQEFRDAKKDWEKVKSHRHTSNNSIVFRSWGQIENFDWTSLVADMSTNGSGEPGLLNLPLIWKTDPGARGVNPCGEQALHDREACNLAEVFPAQFQDGTDPVVAFRLVTRYCLRQRLTPLSDAKSHSVGLANMRVGVGLGGLCDFEWTNEQLNRWYQECRQEASAYAKELGVASPITVTTVKPSGTISLLNESSPGIHAPYAPFYLRRTRIAKNDPLAEAMMEAGVPYEQCVYDSTGNTWAFAFPTKAVHTRYTVLSETIRDQFERQKRVQDSWADNAVSSTLSFEKHETNELAKCLKEYVPSFKSTSCLPKEHGYDQAPYEAIDEATYRELASKINHDHQLARGGEIETQECAGGACPIR